jgi:chemotaxis signal transduction protein
MNSAQDGRRVAVEVDEVLDVEDTVIKAIHPILNTLEIYRGITFLDDGTLGLILSTSGVMDALNLTQEASLKRHMKSEAKTGKTEAESAVKDKRALLFTLPVSGTYALKLEEVHRVEEVQESSIKRSGMAPVILYRGKVLEIRDLGELFGGSPFASGTSDSEGRFPLIVVERGNGLLGLKVSEVKDMVNYTEVQNNLEDPSHAIEGHFFNQEKSVTLLSLAQVLGLLDRGSPAGGSYEEVEESEASVEAVA